jgi:two-component system, LytTR family, sensor kinase
VKSPLKAKYIRIALHVMIWTMLLLLPYFVSNPHNGYKVGSLPWPFITIADFIHIGLFYANAFFLFPRFLNRRRWLLYLLGSFLLILASFELKLLVLTIFFPEAHKEVSAAKFFLGPSIGIYVISCIYRVILDRIRMEREQKERQAAQLATELKFLRSQISPHFLFNVLTNLVSLARKRSDKLEPSLIMLSDLMRYMLYDTQGKRVELRTEVEYLNSYVELQKLRFGNDVEIVSRIELKEEDQSHSIEPMLLIPFVENAFKHGVSIVERPHIDIRLSVNGNCLCFEVCNAFDEAFSGGKEESSGLGLKNVVSRLNLLYKGHHDLTIRKEKNQFHITLNLQFV